jgi:hypothetical protein
MPYESWSDSVAGVLAAVLVLLVVVLALWLS